MNGSIPDFFLFLYSCSESVLLELAASRKRKTKGGDGLVMVTLFSVPKFVTVKLSHEFDDCAIHGRTPGRAPRVTVLISC